MATRRYEQRLRATSAEQTRQRVLDAMYEQLPTLASVDAVARLAGVARSTVYLIFGSRAGLFDALCQDVLDRGGFSDLVRAVESPDPLAHLRGMVQASTRMYAAQRDALNALLTMQHSLDGAVDRAERGRLGGMEYLAGRLHDSGLLAVPQAEAVDTLWMLTSFQAFDLLYTGRNRSVDDTAASLVRQAEQTLLVT